MPRRCVFCGGTPVSQEHALPKWLGRLFTNEVVDFSRTFQFRGDAADVRPWRGKPFSATVGGPCRTCNSGWMSELETEVQPVLTPLVEGREATLSALSQHLVATWAIKTMLMLRLVAADDDDRELDPGIYRWLREQRSPPPSEQVWLAAYAGEGQWPVTFHYFAAEVAPPEAEQPPEPNAHSAAFAIGHAAFGITGNRIEAAPVAEPQLPSDVVRVLWPTTGDSMAFPPPRWIAGDGEMRSLALPAAWTGR